jgi:hypothetical protein
MVKFIKHIVILLLIIISILSCSVKKRVIDDEVQICNKKVSFGLDMGMLVECYTKNHKKSPTCAKDLINWIESIDEDSQLIYYRQYKYLKKNEKKLIFTTETEEVDS